MHGRAGTNLPPLARNAVAVPEVGATSVSVDVLTGTVDPDDAQGELTVTKVFNATEATINGGTVTVPVTDVPQVFRSRWPTPEVPSRSASSTSPSAARVRPTSSPTR